MTCGGKYSLWTARGDGLCKECGAKADEAKKREAHRKEVERKQRVLEGAKRNIELILKAMTDQPPVIFTFINRGITTKKSSGLGLIIGGVLYGIQGAILGNIFDGSSVSYSGEIGILVVTPTQVLVSYFAAPILSQDGRICSDHLELFVKRLKAHKVDRRSFDIRRTQLTMHPEVVVTKNSTVTYSVVTLGSGPDAFSFQKSDLYVNDVCCDLPSISAIYGAIEGLGPLVTPTQFSAKLEKGENPIPEDQFAQLPDGDKYMAEVFGLLFRHCQRNALIQNFPRLAPNVRYSLKQRFEEKRSRISGAKALLILSVTLAVAGGAAASLAADGVRIISVLGVIACVISGVAAAISLRGATWCRDVLNGGSTI